MKQLIIIFISILLFSCLVKKKTTLTSVIFEGKITAKAHPIWKLDYELGLYSEISIVKDSVEYYRFKTDTNGFFSQNIVLDTSLNPYTVVVSGLEDYYFSDDSFPKNRGYFYYCDTRIRPPLIQKNILINEITKLNIECICPILKDDDWPIE